MVLALGHLLQKLELDYTGHRRGLPPWLRLASRHQSIWDYASARTILHSRLGIGR